MEMHFATVWEAIADAVPDAPAVVQGARPLDWRATSSAPRGSRTRSRRRARTPRQGGDVPLQLARVLRDELRGDQDPRRPDQRQLPLSRPRAHLPARQRRRRGARLPQLARRPRRARALAACPSCGCSSRSTTVPPPTAPATSTAPCATTSCKRRSPRRPRIAPRGRRALHALHGRHDGHAEGRDVRDERLHAVLPEDLSADDRDGEARLADELPALGPRAARRRASARLDVRPPLMHGTGCWLGMMVPHMLGGTAALLEKRGRSIRSSSGTTVARERRRLLVIVGDAFARPMLRALDENPGRWDASCPAAQLSSPRARCSRSR